MPLTIRPATPDDLERFLPLFLGLSRFNRSHHPQNDEFQAVLDVRTQHARRALESSRFSRVYLGLAADGRPVGYVWASIQQPSPAASDGTMLTGIIAELFVDEGYRDRGLGMALMNAACDWFRQTGVQRLKVEAFAWNDAAIRFYERLGFETTSITLMRPFG